MGIESGKFRIDEKGEVTRGLPRRTSHSLADLKSRWAISLSDLRHWLMGGYLKAHVWLPVMSVYKMLGAVETAGSNAGVDLCHWEGYVPLPRHSCYRLFRQGRVCLRQFTCEQSGTRYSLPETAEAFVVSVDEIVILEEERARFEAAYGLNQQSETTPTTQASDCQTGSGRFISDSSFKIIRKDEDQYILGNMQAAILRELYLRAKNGEPWQSGKLLLRSVGSQSFTVSNVFKRNPIWRELVISDRRGAYRIDLENLYIAEK